MKILYVTTISNTINGFLIPHIKLLFNLGHTVDVACNVVQELSPELIKLGCNIHHIGFQRTPLRIGNFKAYREIKKIVKVEDYDLVHTHTPIASFITRIACRNMSGTRILYTAHGFHFYKGAPLINWLVYYPFEMLAAKHTDVIVTLNEEDYITARKLKNEVDCIYKVNGVGVDLLNFTRQIIEEKYKLRMKYGYSENDFILIYTAELNNNKQQNLLIEVVDLLKTKVPNIKLLLAGSGPLMNKLQDRVNRLGLSNRIDFLGYRSDIPNLLKLSDVAVSASRREGLPVNIMEAMATGLPLVVSNCRGNRDLVSDGHNGYVVGLDDAEKFADSIEKLYNSKELRQQFGNKGLQLINGYSLESVIRQMNLAYSRMLAISLVDQKSRIERKN